MASLTRGRQSGILPPVWSLLHMPLPYRSSLWVKSETMTCTRVLGALSRSGHHLPSTALKQVPIAPNLSQDRLLGTLHCLSAPSFVHRTRIGPAAVQLRYRVHRSPRHFSAVQAGAAPAPISPEVPGTVDTSTASVPGIQPLSWLSPTLVIRRNALSQGCPDLHSGRAPLMQSPHR